jgi:transcriptional regulator with XRE-family HTH domain
VEASLTHATHKPTHHGQTVAEYRRHKNWSQMQLADALRVDVRTVQRIEGQPVIKNLDRRRLLVGVLGIPAVLLGIDAQPHQTAITATGQVAINQDRMSFFEEEMATRWDMYHTGGTIRAARGLPTWIDELTTFASAARGTAWQQRAYSLLSLSYQLQSCTARDLMRYDDAHQAYRKAAQIARALEHAELMSAARAREGVTLLQQGRPADAIPILTAALEGIRNASAPTLRGYILQALSEAYAHTQAADTQAAARASPRR